MFRGKTEGKKRCKAHKIGLPLGMEDCGKLGEGVLIVLSAVEAEGLWTC